MSKKVDWKSLPFGAVILEPGSSLKYKTAEWRRSKPEYYASKCTKCALCWVYCPEGAIRVLENGFIEIDLDYCKGCGICAKECPVEAIIMVREE
jgi:pyruvate ferredoxin oxidoreductase delta subunit